MKKIWLPYIALALAGLACDSDKGTKMTHGGADASAGRSGSGGSGGAMGTGGVSGGSGGTVSGGSTATVGSGGSGGGGIPTAVGGTASGGSTTTVGSGGSTANGGSSGGGSTASVSGGAGSSGSGGSSGGAGGGTVVDSTELVGWATEGAGTTGGGNATPIEVTSLADLNKHAGGSDAKVIHYSGQGSGTLKVGSNKTIIGKTGAQVKNGGQALNLSGSKNVIIKNITFIGTPDGSADMAVISNGNHIWLDHLELVDGGDGMLDIVGTSDYITISWCKMRYTGQTGHQNAMLLASSNGSGESAGHMKVTFHHNWWAENVTERAPRVRFGQVHIFNNLYVATPNWTYYAIRCGWKANVRSERNIYKDYTGTSPPGATVVFNYFDGSPDSVLETVEDVFINCAAEAIDGNGVKGGTFGNGTAFKPPYAYTPDPTEGLEERVRAGAGPH